MLMRVGVLVSMRMDCAIGMLMLVGVDVRVDVGVQMFVLDLSRHDILLGKLVRLAAAIASQQAMNSMPSGENGPGNV